MKIYGNEALAKTYRKSVENLWKRGSGENQSKICRKSMETRFWRTSIENLLKVRRKSSENKWKRGSGENLSKIYRKSIGHLWRQGSGENLSKIDCKSEQRTPMGHEPDETAHGTTRCRQRDSCPCKQRTHMGHECKSKENGGVTRGQSMDHDQGRGLDLSMEFDRKRLQSLWVNPNTRHCTAKAPKGERNRNDKVFGFNRE